MFHCNAGPPISALSEIDLSWNSHLSPFSLLELLSTPSLAGLRSLRLRGCSCPVGILPIPTSLPVDQKTLASCVWFPDSSAKLVSPLTSHIDAATLVSNGDQLILTLAQAMIKVSDILLSARIAFTGIKFAELTCSCFLRVIFLAPMY